MGDHSIEAEPGSICVAIGAQDDLDGERPLYLAKGSWMTTIYFPWIFKGPIKESDLAFHADFPRYHMLHFFIYN